MYFTKYLRVVRLEVSILFQFLKSLKPSLLFLFLISQESVTRQNQNSGLL